MSLPIASNVVCHSDARFGGMSSSVPALADATAGTSRYDVQLLALCLSNEVMSVGFSHAVRVRQLPLSRFRGIADYSLRRVLDPLLRGSDVIHVHGVWQQHSVVCGRFADKTGTPMVVSAHGMLEPWAVNNKRWKKVIYSALVERPNLSRCACLRALTRVEVEDFRRYGLRNPAFVIPNGVTPPAGVTPEGFLAQFPELRGRRLIMYLSRIHFKKGLDPLCRAWARVSARFPEACLVLAGPDFENTRSSVDALVADLGITDRVFFPGMLAGGLKWSALKAAEAFILPSFSEGFSMAVLEAMAMERPVIATRQCNFPEISDVGAGWLIEAKADEITDALIECLSAPAKRLQEMGARGSALVHSRYNWDTIGGQMADVYDWMSGGGPKPPTMFE